MTDAANLRKRRIGAFLQIADEEMRAAETLLTVLPRQSAFFQQQCVEKLLRAVLEAEARVAGPTHNLRTLVDLLPLDHLLKEWFLAFEELTSAATRYRYPSGSGDAPKVSAEIVVSPQSRIVELRDKVEAYLNARPAN